jgi:hypothetical protein
MYFVFQDDLNRRNYYYGFSKDQLDFIGSLIDGGYLTDEKLIVKYFSCRLNDKSVIEKIDAILDKYKLITLGYLARHLHEGLVLDISYLHSFFDEMTQSNGNIPRGICKEVRSRYMLIEPSYGQYAQEIIICRGYEDLAKVDFKEAARLLPYRVLPNYSLDFTDADGINYARAFLFHMGVSIRKYHSHVFLSQSRKGRKVLKHTQRLSTNNHRCFSFNAPSSMASRI